MKIRIENQFEKNMRKKDAREAIWTPKCRPTDAQGFPKGSKACSPGLHFFGFFPKALAAWVFVAFLPLPPKPSSHAILAFPYILMLSLLQPGTPPSIGGWRRPFLQLSSAFQFHCNPRFDAISAVSHSIAVIFP